MHSDAFLMPRRKKIIKKKLSASRTHECFSPNPAVVVTFFRTILLSVISLLNEPNTFSPANVDASVMFRKWRDSKGKDKEYAEIIR